MMNLEIPTTWQAARETLLPVLRGVSSPSNAWPAEQRRVDATLVRQPGPPFLHLLVAMDLERVRLFVNQGHLQTWSAVPQAALTAALENLDPTPDLTLRSSGVWQLTASDESAASRLMLPGWLRAFEGEVQGEPVAFVPDTQTLWVCGLSDTGALQRLLWAAARRYRDEAHPVSPAPYTVDASGVVVPLELPVDHPSSGEVHTAHQTLAGTEYAAQGDQLMEHEPFEGMMVVRYGLIRDKNTGRTRSFTCWPKEARALMPRADVVYFGSPYRPFDEGPTVPWDAVMAIAGAWLQERADLRPLRFETTGWPEEVMEKLREASVR